MSPGAIEAVVFGENNRPYHEIDAVGPILESFLSDAGIEVDVSTDRSLFARPVLDEYDVVVNYHPSPRTSEWELTREEVAGIRSFVRDGGGYVPLHAALAFPDGPLYREHADLAGGRLIGHGDPGEIRVEITDRRHPVTDGVDSFTIRDEPYGMEHDPDVDVLATVEHETIGTSAVCWATEAGDGRVCYGSARRKPRPSGRG